MKDIWRRQGTRIGLTHMVCDLSQMYHYILNMTPWGELFWKDWHPPKSPELHVPWQTHETWQIRDTRTPHLPPNQRERIGLLVPTIKCSNFLSGHGIGIGSPWRHTCRASGTIKVTSLALNNLNIWAYRPVGTPKMLLCNKDCKQSNHNADFQLQKSGMNCGERELNRQPPQSEWNQDASDGSATTHESFAAYWTMRGSVDHQPPRSSHCKSL